nr:hypothetical protein [Tanacetum cinerariifolium]
MCLGYEENDEAGRKFHQLKDLDIEISGLKARVKSLEDKERRCEEPIQEDAPITRGIIDIGEELGVDKSTKKGSNDTEEMVNVLSSMEAANILSSGGTAFSTASVSPADVFPTASVPTVSAIFTTNSVATPYIRMSRAEADLSVGEKIELISELVKYQDHLAEILKYQAQQSTPSSKKEQRRFYMSVLKSHAGWKTELFRGMTLERIKEKFIPISHTSRSKPSQEQQFKVSKGVFEEELKGMMQLVPLEDVYIKALQVKHPIIDWEIHSEGKREYWKIIRLGGHTRAYQFFVDIKQFDREDLHQLWIFVKETFKIKQCTRDKENELWVELKRLFEPDSEDQLWTYHQAFMHDPLEWKLYDTCGVHHVSTKKNQEIFMLVEKDYPLRKGLATVMINNKLQESLLGLIMYRTLWPIKGVLSSAKSSAVATQQWNSYELTVGKYTSKGITITSSGNALEHFIHNRIRRIFLDEIRRIGCQTGLELVRYDVSKVLDTSYWGFLE